MCMQSKHILLIYSNCMAAHLTSVSGWYAKLKKKEKKPNNTN